MRSPPQLRTAPLDDNPPGLRVAVSCVSRRIPALAPGGAAVHLREMAAGFSAHGPTSLWVARSEPGRRGPPAEPPAGVGLRTFERGHLPGTLRRKRAWDEAVDARAARRQALAWHRGRPIDLLYERASLFGRLGRLPGALRVVELNAPLAWEAVLWEEEPARPALLRAEARSLADADLVVVVSAPLAAWALRRGVPEDRLLVLPNGADPTPPTTPAPAGAPLRVGCASTWKPWQGHRADLPALAALARRRPIHLDLWGDGPERAGLAAAIEAAGIPCSWRGWGRPEQLAAEPWDAVWLPEPPWPPPGGAGAAAALGEPLPDRYFSPLKGAEAAARGLPLLRGGALLSSPASPLPWAGVAAAVLAALAGRGLVPAAGRSCLNAGVRGVEVAIGAYLGRVGAGLPQARAACEVPACEAGEVRPGGR